MKRYFFLLTLAVVIAAGSYALTRGLMPPRKEEQMTWLTHEFKLTPAQVAAVEKLQADYGPVCAGHCQEIMAARARLASAPGDATVQADLNRLAKKCQDATRRHLQDVAAQMAPAQGRRFLALVEPKVARHEHEGPFGLK